MEFYKGIVGKRALNEMVIFPIYPLLITPFSFITRLLPFIQVLDVIDQGFRKFKFGLSYVEKTVLSEIYKI